MDRPILKLSVIRDNTQPKDETIMEILKVSTKTYNYIKENNLLSLIYDPKSKFIDKSATFNSTSEKIENHVLEMFKKVRLIIRNVELIASEYLRAKNHDIITSILMICPYYMPEYDINDKLVVPLPESQLTFVFDRRLNMKEACESARHDLIKLDHLLYNIDLLGYAQPPELLSEETRFILKEGANIETTIKDEHTKNLKTEKFKEKLVKEITRKKSLGL